MPRCFLLFLLSAALIANAQDASTGAIRGSVSDPAGGRIPAATVVLVNSANGQRFSVRSDFEGHFTFDVLPPGDYSARAIASGMSPEISPNLHVDVAGTTEINFKMQIAGSKETIIVSDEPKLVETQPSSISSLIDEHAITGLPLNGRRFTDLALLTPGVTQDPRGLTSGSNGDLAFGGIRGFQSSYLVDGADNNNGFYAQAAGRYRAPYQFSNEVIQQFRVSSNTYGAELGRSGGAVINVVTKSGSNQIHGATFYFLRNSAFDSGDAFMTSKPHSEQHQFGFTLGGPIRRNRAFFFVSFDQHIFHLPTVVQFVNGSNVVIPQAGTGPYTPGDYELSDQPLVFATAAHLSQQAGQFPSQLLGNAGFVKLDMTVSPRNYLSLRVNTSRYWGQNNVFIDPASPLTTYGIADNGIEHVDTESASLSLTSSINARFVSHLRAQFSRDLEWSSDNTNAPLTRIANVIDGFGRSSLLPRETRQHRLHLTETFSVEGRRNSWKFGGDGLFSWIYDFFPSQFGGEYIFNEIKVDPFTFAPQEGGLELTPLRAYAHEVPHYYVQSFGNAVTNPNTNEYAAFAQDTIRITNHLALSIGARYDLQTFTTKGLITNPLWQDSGKVPFNPYNFAPRLGLAYALGDHRPLVIRSGYGLFYTRIPQIYNSAIQSQNGISNGSLFLNDTNYYDNQAFRNTQTRL